jgi:hypothetical protein
VSSIIRSSFKAGMITDTDVNHLLQAPVLYGR